MAGRKRRIQEVSKNSGKDDVITIESDEDSTSGSGQKDTTVSLVSPLDSANESNGNSKLNGGSTVEKKNNASNSGGNDDGIDIKIPYQLLMTGTSTGSNECTVLVQVSPEDAPTLDFHGAGGAVGRLEVNNRTVTVDVKGYQYQGGIQAGPTCLIASMHPMMGENMMKVESITDEFVALQKTGDQLAQLDAVVEKGEMDDSFKVRYNDVNSRSNTKDANNKGDIDSADNKNSGDQVNGKGGRGKRNSGVKDAKGPRKRKK